MDYFIDTGELGSDRNSGTHRRSPRKTLFGAKALPLKEKDRLLIRDGSTFTDSLAWAFNGVTVMPYSLGTERETGITLKLPRREGVKGLAVAGIGNTFDGLTIIGAETGVFVEPLAIGNRFQRTTIEDFGHGFLNYASDTMIVEFMIARGRMIRNVTTEDYVGASGITLWKHEHHACRNILISGGQIHDAWAWRVPKEDGKDTDGDGAGLEIFGGVKDVVASDLEVKASKILVEIGGTRSRNETTSNVRFIRCKTSGPSGKCVYINDPAGTFGINWQGYSFDRCTFIADGYPESAFYLSGNHGNLSTRLSITNSTIVGAAQILNGGKGTLLETFQHSGNTFWRSDGSKNLGFKLDPSDRFQAP